MVASSAPLDQFVVEHPDYFFGRSPEHAYINPQNLEILLAHLKCAAFELPIRDGEPFGPHATTDLCRFLEESGFLHHSGDSWHWTTDSYPADSVSLRSVSSDNFVVIDTTNDNKVIADVAFTAALVTLHEKAIYLHERTQYHVDRFDYEERKAYVHRVDCDYYTDAVDYTQIKILQEFEAEPFSGTQRLHGEVRVNRQIVGFKKIKFYTNENVGAGRLNMPEQEMHTTAFWLHFPEPFLDALGDYTTTEREQGISGLGNVLRTVASLLLMCDPNDLGLAFDETPNLFLYDAYPGGIGQSAPLFRLTPKLVQHASDLLSACGCEAGCPSCVGPVGEIGERGKEVAAAILTALKA
jgi:DEAD/DEAH box helicase domain-containing protein